MGWVEEGRREGGREGGREGRGKVREGGEGGRGKAMREGGREGKESCTQHCYRHWLLFHLTWHSLPFAWPPLLF